MTIDGYDIAGLHCRQHRVAFGHSDVKSDSEWTEGAVLPSFYQNHLKMLEMTLTIAVYGSSRLSEPSEDAGDDADYCSIRIEPV